ncbi:MAG: hypothetical protein FD166_2941 [Bacteroidetes bacterium]|nr:MAG: hypothetical protein FD166_2941 [Bacteroidota bacterium]
MNDATLLHNMEPDDLEKMFEAKAEKMIRYNPEKFYSVIIPASWVCHIHQISKATLQRWVEQDIIIPEPREKDGNLNFRLSEVLKFNVDAIKRKRNKQFIMNGHV